MLINEDEVFGPLRGYTGRLVGLHLRVLASVLALLQNGVKR